MKIIYRPAGSMMSLDEALAQSKEFNTMEDFLDFLVDYHENAFAREDLVFSYYDYDDRTGWQDYLACTKRYDDKDYMKMYNCPQAIAYFTFKYDKEEN